MGMNELADRCGVSLQYLSHVGRYGRVPSRPILTLLAFNLEAENPSALFQAAKISEPWPYEGGIGLRQKSAADSGLFSVSFDMQGFTSVIREIVRSEVKPKRLPELLGNRPLRVGLNRGQFFFFIKPTERSKAEGFFPDLVRSLALSLQCQVEFIEVSHTDFATELEGGRIDLFGPVYRTPARIGRALFTNSFCTVPVAALWRKKEHPTLQPLPPPRKIAELQKRSYMIAVHRDSVAHQRAETELGISPDRLIPCEVADEATERIILQSLPRPAHLLLTDLPFAKATEGKHQKAVSLITFLEDSGSSSFEDAIAIRPDWTLVPAVINEALDLLRNAGTITRLADNSGEGIVEGGVILR
jgi:hypothetical protein